MNNLDTAKNASVNTWESSNYTNLLSLDCIITTTFPKAKSAWEDYMQRCGRLLATCNTASVDKACIQQTIRTHIHTHIRTLRTRYTMTSSQQPLRSSWDPQDPATHRRLGVPVPDLLPVRELQPYKNWVEHGGLDRIASAHGIKPDFICHLSEHTPAVYLAYRHALEAVPGLANIMAPTPRTFVARLSPSML